MKFDEEQELRAALRRAFEVAAPPPKTDVTWVIEQARRRARSRRYGAFAVVALIVSGVAVGSYWLRSSIQDSSNEPGRQVAAGAAPPPRPDAPGTFEWTPIAPTPSTSPERPDGGAVASCGQGSSTIGGSSAQLGEAIPAFEQAIRDVARVSPATARWSDSDSQVSVEFGLDKGGVRLETGVYVGSPVQGADADVKVHGNCALQQRTTSRLDESVGSVLQLYQPVKEGQQLVQAVRVYLHDGRMYVITQFTPSTAESKPATSGGTPLPLSTEQLSAIGSTVARSLAYAGPTSTSARPG